jgi:hypothetical protein
LAVLEINSNKGKNKEKNEKNVVKSNKEKITR